MKRAGWTGTAILGAALLLLTLAAFEGVLSNGFVACDDGVYVTGNPHVLGGLHGESVAWAFTTTGNSNWHPLTWLSHMLDVQFYGLDAGKHHRTSLALHALNALLLFLLLHRMTGALWRSALVASLFAIHPLHVESVAWIAERKDVLCTLFWLLTLAAWLFYLESKTIGRHALVLALYALGLMAKPMLVTLPFTLLLLDYWPLRRLSEAGAPRRLASLAREKAPLFLMSFASSIVTLAAQRSGGAVQTLERFPVAERLANSLLSLVGYLGKTIWPTSLAVFYPYPHVGLATWPVAGAAVLLACITAGALLTAKKAPFFIVGWLWYLGTLAPVIGFIQVGEQAMADRYTYLPLVGVFIAVAWGLSTLASSARAARYAVAAAVAVWLVTLLAVTRLQVRTWAGSVALFEHALAVTSDNWMAHNNLGSILSDAGRTDEAIAHFGEVLRIRPDFPEGQYNLGLVLERTGRHLEAIGHYQEALRLRPDYTDARFNLGNSLLHAGRLAEAIEQYQEVLRLDPGFVGAATNLRLARARKELSRG